MSYRENIVKKPWGYEYLVYENDHVGVWMLDILHNESTSMHIHSTKITGLVMLDGTAEISFMADIRKMSPLEKVMIRRGLFHSTKSTSINGTRLLEIESPNDKGDLVRLYDKYGRSSKSYEDASYEELKDNKCIWIDDPILNSPNNYNLHGCCIKIELVDDINALNNKKDDDVIIFLKGGIIKKINNVYKTITVPGDVGYGHIVKQVTKYMEDVMPETIILTINKQI